MKDLLRISTLILLAVTLLVISACSGGGIKIPDETLAPGATISVGRGITLLSANTGVQRETAGELDADNVRAAADFALNLLREANGKNKNELISPLSVMLALAMTSNGAWGETRAEMEEVLGMSVEELNSFLNSYVQSLKNTEDASLVAANSVWISNDRGFNVRTDFIEKAVKYYDAGIVSAPFGDEETLGAINNWVKDNTDGMIEKILDELDPEAVMLLINALSFDAFWQKKFEEEARDGTFTNADGSTTTAKFMSDAVSDYISGFGCTGFKKNYAGGAYSYVALLPEKGKSTSDFLASLDGEDFLSLVNNSTKNTVEIKMPKYTLDYELVMNDVLKKLGMPSAFSGSKADFSALGSMDNGQNIFISRVIHKTHIEVDESGTRAAAVTAVEMKPTSIAVYEKSVILDRPFVYAIVDNATGLPVFIGTIENLG
ncbi:MAG: serpin family protein [Eubacteriales bacterium]